MLSMSSRARKPRERWAIIPRFNFRTRRERLISGESVRAPELEYALNVS